MGRKKPSESVNWTTCPALWCVWAEHVNSSGGGDYCFYVITDNCLVVPDVRLADAELNPYRPETDESNGSYRMYAISRIKRIHSLPRFPHDEIVDQRAGCNSEISWDDLPVAEMGLKPWTPENEEYDS